MVPLLVQGVLRPRSTRWPWPSWKTLSTRAVYFSSSLFTVFGSQVTAFHLVASAPVKFRAIELVRPDELPVRSGVKPCVVAGRAVTARTIVGTQVGITAGGANAVRGAVCVRARIVAGVSTALRRIDCIRFRIAP